MTITQTAAGFVNNYAVGLETLGISNVTVGDYRILAVKVGSSTPTVTGVSGGGVTTWSKIEAFVGYNGHDVELWGGIVTATGSATITVAFTATPTVNVALWSSELVWSGGIPSTWTVYTQGGVNGASGSTYLYPSLTSYSANDQIYWGFAQINGTGAVGTTTGFTYSAINGNGDGACFNGALALSTAYQPNQKNAGTNTATLVACIIEAVSTR